MRFGGGLNAVWRRFEDGLEAVCKLLINSKAKPSPPKESVKFKI